MSFKDKVVVVTGSSSGIGASTAIEFAKEGAHVVIVEKNDAKVGNIREKCDKYGKTPLVIIADVSKDANVKRIVNETIQKFGRIDVLVNNAGTCEMGDIANENFMEGYDRIVNVNLRGVVQITHKAIPHLIKSKGNIINISSVAGTNTLGSPDLMAYSVSKAGLTHFSRCAALKLASYGVRVNTISPGPVRTDIINHPTMKSITWEQIGENTVLKRVSDPKEIADVILYLASDKARGITGSNFVSDNGMMIVN